MAEIKPFRGITYNQKKVANLSKVLAPPYDTISQERQNELYMRSSFNIIRLILGIDLPNDSSHESKYTRAKQYLEQWLDSKILIRDETPCFYIYAQDYTLDRQLTRWGVIGLYKIQGKDKNTIFPHEHTYSEPKQDRLNLIKEVESNLSPIFTVFTDTDNLTGYIKSMCERWEPYIDTEIDNVRHRMWKLRDRVSVNNIMESMENKQLFIADGHHRLEVAIEYQRICREKLDHSASMDFGNSFDYVMLYFTSIEDEGLSILPTHRLVKLGKENKVCLEKIKNFFKVKLCSSLRSLRKSMAEFQKKDESVIGLYGGDSRKYYILKLKDKALRDIDKDNQFKLTDFIDKLEVLLLHQVLFKYCMDKSPSNIEYTHSAKEAVDKVKQKEFDAAFLLNSIKIQQFQEIVRTGEKLPPKTTFFYPKAITGLTIYKF